MIIHRAPQGTPEWHAARVGVITASMFSTVRKKINCLTAQQQTYVNALRSGLSEAEAMLAAGYKAKPRAEGIERALDGERVGEYSDAAKDYAFRLAIERISGQALEEGFETWQMRRGRELEPAARRAHEARTGLLVEEAGFITTDDGIFGASADGLIDNDGGAEYKCFLEPGKLRAILLTGDVSEVVDQCDGGLWISGRVWWDFGLYCPALESVGLDLTLHRIQRDDNRINALEADMWEFAQLVSEFEDQLRQKAA